MSFSHFNNHCIHTVRSENWLSSKSCWLTLSRQSWLRSEGLRCFIIWKRPVFSFFISGLMAATFWDVGNLPDWNEQLIICCNSDFLIVLNKSNGIDSRQLVDGFKCWTKHIVILWLLNQNETQIQNHTLNCGLNSSDDREVPPLQNKITNLKIIIQQITTSLLLDGRNTKNKEKENQTHTDLIFLWISRHS